MQFKSSLSLGLAANAAAASFQCKSSHSTVAFEDTTRESAKQTGQLAEQQNIEVNTYVHVIGASEKVADGYIDQETVQSEMDKLNEDFKPHNFSFKLIETTRTVNESWANWPDGTPGRVSVEEELRASLRKGTYKDLNLYFINNMMPNGRCELPVPNPTEKEIINDGCMMRSREPGEEPPEFGLVTTHEVGHWLGLRHTFENGCEFPGDGVEDTPYQEAPFDGEGCPQEGYNTCPDLPGVDPNDNFMNYVDPDCGPFKFTPGQAQRMHMMWEELRA